MARTRHPDIYLEDLCVNAQQAAERAFKGLLPAHGAAFPYIHDLGELLGLLEQSGEHIPDRVREAAQLTDYAVEARYPGLAEAVDREEHQEALGLAEEVVRWVETRLAARQRG